MLPVTLDPKVLPALLVGGGPCTLKRVATLDAAGIRLLAIHAPEPDEALVRLAGDRLVRRLPTLAEIRRARLLFTADLPDDLSADLAATARANGLLVNVEDRPPLCDFHVPAIVRRGDLSIAVSTSGRSPALASRLKRYLEDHLGDVWAERLDQIGRLRQTMRARGARPAEVQRASLDLIDAQGWLPRERTAPPLPPH